MKVLKFGGKSLANGIALEGAIDIMVKESAKEASTIVVSARADATNKLLEMYELASEGKSFAEKFKSFRAYQELEGSLSADFQKLFHALEALRKLRVKSDAIQASILAYGEILSAKTIARRLEKKGKKAIFKDARDFLFTTTVLNEETIDYQKTTTEIVSYYKTISSDEVPVVTGFIATNELGETTTLGRNGSNYSATLVANCINASEVQNWTNVDGVYSANPEYVSSAQKIPHLSYQEANELANFGVNLLHPQTIEPLIEKGIPLKIYNSFDSTQAGTLIDKNGGRKGIKAVSVIEDVALIILVGKGLSGQVGIDGRVFSVLSQNNISVKLVSQASSERGIGFVIDKKVASKVKDLLIQEFQAELQKSVLSKIEINEDTAIVAIVGRHNYALEKAIKGLRQNKIWMYLINNSISGDHISLVIEKKDLKKALNVVHSHVFGVTKTINVFCLGKGVVGATLIDQVLDTDPQVVQKRELLVRIIGIADSTQYIYDPEGIGFDWRNKLKESTCKSDLSKIIEKLKASHLENIVIADNTASQLVTDQYASIFNAGFDIVASNKRMNSGSLEAYNAVSALIQKKKRSFYYETNVGAGLPIIDTLKHLRDSADEITEIRGVFSGSLSYIFNTFSKEEKQFFEVLEEAKEKGYTEPDPREDLCGLDVARKLVILAREIGLSIDLNDVEVENLIPTTLREEGNYDAFCTKRKLLDEHYLSIKHSLLSTKVLRYIGAIDVDKEALKVSLIETDERSPLGGIQGADSIFEIYTKAYRDKPIVIQGAGAGGEVTARGVYSDLIRMGKSY